MAITPERVLHELGDLWVSLGKQGAENAGVLRACAMTLLVLAEETDDAAAIGETIAALMPEHPSRAIVMRVRTGGGGGPSAHVFAQCWLPFGQRRQICCEQIEINASEASLPDLPALVLPLVVPDLPVFLWCRSPRLFNTPGFREIAALARKVVVDGNALGDPAAALERLSQPGPKVADLSWTRLTRWRALISQMFDNSLYTARLSGIREVRVTAAGLPSWYMAAWLLNGLGDAGANARLVWDAADDLRLVSLSGDDILFSIALGEGNCAEVRTGDLVSRAPLPRPNDYALLREELAIPGRDAVFERTLAAAARLVYLQAR